MMLSFTVSPESVATWFINNVDRDAGESITHLKLQKLLYYSHAWFLALFDRRLFDEEFQAWAHGPVLPSIFHKYKSKAWSALEQESPCEIPEDLEDFLAAVYSEYGQFSAKRLEEITHQEDPWRITRGYLPPEARCDEPIDNLIIRNYYAARNGKEEIQALN